jgi:hypothetical protein
VCWAESEAEARKTALSVWPNAGVPGQLSQDLPTPAHFEMAAKTVREDDVAERVLCGPDVDRWVEFVNDYAQAGYSHVYLHQVGRDQEGFFRFCERELLPALSSAGLV